VTVLAFPVFLAKHQQETWSNNPLERLNQETERCRRVAGKRCLSEA